MRALIWIRNVLAGRLMRDGDEAKGAERWTAGT